MCLQYDALGRPTSITYPDGRDVSLQWGAQGLDRACTGQGCTMSQPIYEVAQRDPMGRPEEEWLSGGVQRMTQYDADGRPEAIDTDFVGDWVSVDQEWDALGRLVSRETQQLGALALGDVGGTEAWTYNAAGWLATEQIDDELWTHSWDAGGNRLSRLNTAGDGWTATYGPDNRLETWDDGTGKQAITYDGLGRRMADLAGNTYAYTPRGRVERAYVGGSQVAAYAYGPDGRRAWEATSAGDRDYVYGPGAWLPYAVNTPAGPENHVLVGGALFGVLGDPGAGNPGAGSSSAITGDGAGTPLFRSGTNGALDHQTRWDAYGTPITTGGSALSTTWKQLLPSGPDVGLMAAGVRDYDPTTGTWMQPDPMGVDGGINLYRYAEGDPVNATDPSGYCVSAETPEWLLEQQREQAELSFQRHSGWDPRKGDPTRMAMRTMPNYCQIATDGTLIDCGGTNQSRDYFMAASDRAYANRKEAEAQWDAASAALASVGYSKDKWMRLSHSSRSDAMQPVFELVRLLNDVDHRVSWTMRYGGATSAAFTSFGARHPDAAPAARSDLLAQFPNAIAGKAPIRARAGGQHFFDPVTITGTVPYGSAPGRPVTPDQFRARHGGPDENLLDLGTLRDGGEVGIRFNTGAEVNGFGPEMAEAIAIANGDIPMPRGGASRAVLENVARVWDWERNGGAYATATLVGGTYYGVVGLGIQFFGDLGESQFGPLAGLAADVGLYYWLRAGFQNTSMPPEDQMIAATVLAEVGLGLLGAAGEVWAGARLTGAPWAKTRGSSTGHGYAREVLEGGTGRAFAGHGEYRYGSGTTSIPEGTTLTLWTQKGEGIPDGMGKLIEQGRYADLAANPRYVAIMEGGGSAHTVGAASWLPGAEIPNYHLTAPAKLRIFANSATVQDPTQLSELLTPNMGHVDWAACLRCR